MDYGEIKGRLLLMADQGDYGRKPDPTDVRRLAAKAITALEARVAELEHGLNDIRYEAEREKGGWVHMKRVIGINARRLLENTNGQGDVS